MKLKTYGSVFAERYGAGSPRILALHGWGRDRTDFRAVLQPFDALAVDLPGFGVSPAPTEAMGSRGYAAALGAVLEEFGEPPVVLGHSFGGRVAVHVAAARPTRRLILTGVPLLRHPEAPSPALGFRLWKGLHRLGLVSPERMESVRRRHGSTDYRAARGVMREVLVEVLKESYEDQLRQLGCRVELIWGADDREVPVAVARAAMALIPDVRLSVIPAAGHLLPLEAPDRLRSALEESM